MMAEHCSGNTKVMGFISVEVRFWLILQLVQLHNNCLDHTFYSLIDPQFNINISINVELPNMFCLQLIGIY